MEKFVKTIILLGTGIYLGYKYKTHENSEEVKDVKRMARSGVSASGKWLKNKMSSIQTKLDELNK